MGSTRAAPPAGAPARPIGWGRAFVLLAGLLAVGFLLAPWPLEVKSTALLHGLCAQRPSHSLWLGGHPLPLDARMTGIYGAALATLLALLARRRARPVGLPRPAVAVALALFVAALALDGVDSTLADLALPALYPPSNALRYATGALTGTTMGVAIWWLQSAVLWQPNLAPRPVVEGWRDLAGLLALAAAPGLVAASGWPPLYAPLALWLVAGVVAVLFGVALPLVQVCRGRVGEASRPTDLGGPALAALVLALAALALLSGGRFLLEAALHLPRLR